MQGGEGDLVMREVGPMDGLEARVLEKFSRLRFEGLESRGGIAVIVNRRDLEGDAGGGEPHALIDEMTGLSEHRHGLKHGLLPAEEVGEGCLVERDFQTRTPIPDERHRGVAKGRRAVDSRVPGGIDDLRVAEFRQPAWAVDELVLHTLATHIDDLPVGGIEKEKIV